MTVEELIRNAFPEGLNYDDSAQLCLALFSFKALPNEMMEQCTKDNLAIVFAKLSSSGFIRTIQTNTATLYGANFHNPKEKGHWIEVIASIFKVGNTVDVVRSKQLLERLSHYRVNVEP